MFSKLVLGRRSCDGRVVKALDLKSNGVSPRRFESCSQRLYFFRTFLRNKKHCIGLCWHQKRDKRKTRPWGKKIKNSTSFKISFPVSKSHCVLFQQSRSKVILYHVTNRWALTSRVCDGRFKLARQSMQRSRQIRNNGNNWSACVICTS